MVAFLQQLPGMDATTYRGSQPDAPLRRTTRLPMETARRRPPCDPPSRRIARGATVWTQRPRTRALPKLPGSGRSTSPFAFGLRERRAAQRPHGARRREPGRRRDAVTRQLLRIAAVESRPVARPGCGSRRAGARDRRARSARTADPLRVLNVTARERRATRTIRGSQGSTPTTSLSS